MQGTLIIPTKSDAKSGIEFLFGMSWFARSDKLFQEENGKVAQGLHRDGGRYQETRWSRHFDRHVGGNESPTDSESLFDQAVAGVETGDDTQRGRPFSRPLNFLGRQIVV